MRKSRLGRIASPCRGFFSRFLIVAVVLNMSFGGLFGAVVTVKAAGAPVPFTEGFGTSTSNSNNVPNWDEDDNNGAGTVAHKASFNNNSGSPDGERFALVDGNDGWICREIDALGFHSLQMLYYWRGDNDAESSDRGIVEYKIGGNCSSVSGWNQFQSHDLSLSESWNTQSEFSISEVDSSSFLLRFRTDSNKDEEDFRVDGISITGIENDTEAPVIAEMEDLHIEAQTPEGQAVWYAYPTATDNVDPTVEVTCEPATGSLFPMGITEITCNAVDEAGNHATPVTFNMIVEDTTPPEFFWDEINPVELLVGDSFDPTEGVSAVDNIDGPITLIGINESVNTSIPDNYPVVYTATDNAGNTATLTRTVMVSDVSAPVINSIADITVEAEGPAGAVVVYGDVYATDDADGDILATCGNEMLFSGATFPIGMTEVICSANDLSGNIGYGTGLVITVVDETAPELTIDPNSPVEATGSTGAVATYTISALDLVDGDISGLVTCDLNSGDTFPLGDSTIICNATDVAGNTGTATATVTVEDTTAPVIEAHTDLFVEATGPGGATIDYGAINAVDLVDGTFAADCLLASGSVFPLEDTTVTCNAFDVAGNDALTTTFNISVQDTTPPVLTLVGDSLINLVIGDVYMEEGATVEDLVDGAGLMIGIGGDAVDTDVLGTYNVTYNATDSAGNEADELVRTVNVNDKPAPVISDETSPSNTTDSITISWTTDHPATSRVIYDTDSHLVLDVAPNYGYANSTVEDVALVTSHSVTVSGLNPGTTYYLRSVSHGSPESVGSEITVTTAELPVVVPPVGGGDGGGAYIPPTRPTLGVVPVVVGGLNSDLIVELLFDVQNAAQMAISESPDFAGVSWETYQESKLFTLSADNTEHKLYIKFRRDTGGESAVLEVTVTTGPATDPIQAVLGVKVTRLDELVARLNFGDRNNEVREIQDLLKEVKFFPVYQTSTGLYWHITLSAVQKYLATKVVPQVLGVKVAGIEGLIAITKYGERSENARALQDELKRAGFFPLVIDSTGYYGQITMGAVQGYQNSVK